MEVSIPSRRVGDFRVVFTPSPAPSFPSPQGGSETLVLTPRPREPFRFHPLKAGRRHYKGAVVLLDELFPSPQGGSETAALAGLPLPTDTVSIPSRRVGDQFRLSNPCPSI